MDIPLISLVPLIIAGLARLLPFFDLPKLAYCDSIVITVHGFFGANETIQVQNPVRSERQLHSHTLPPDGFKIPNAKNLTKAVHGAQIGFQVKVLQSGALFRSQIEIEVRSRTMHPAEGILNTR
jgi:hypothetical protein